MVPADWNITDFCLIDCSLKNSSNSHLGVLIVIHLKILLLYNFSQTCQSFLICCNVVLSVTFQQVFKIYFYGLSLNIGSFSVQFLPNPVQLTSCQQQPLIPTAPGWFDIKCFFLYWLSECKNQPPGLFFFKDLIGVLPTYSHVSLFVIEQKFMSLMSSLTSKGPLHCYHLTLPSWLVPNVFSLLEIKMLMFDLEKLPKGCRSFAISQEARSSQQRKGKNISLNQIKM